jgi:hypothetical protein
LIEEVVHMAQDFPPDVDRVHRYLRITLHINGHPSSRPAVPAFPKDGSESGRDEPLSDRIWRYLAALADRIAHR